MKLGESPLVSVKSLKSNKSLDQLVLGGASVVGVSLEEEPPGAETLVAEGGVWGRSIFLPLAR